MNCRYTTKCNPMVSEYKKPVGISFLLSFTTFRHKFTLNLPIWKIAKHRIVWLWQLLSVRSPRMTWSGFFATLLANIACFLPENPLIILANIHLSLNSLCCDIAKCDKSSSNGQCRIIPVQGGNAKLK